jgi:hypothetical protein
MLAGQLPLWELTGLFHERRVPCPRLCVGMSSALRRAWQRGLVEADARPDDVRPAIKRVLLRGSIDRFDEP